MFYFALDRSGSDDYSTACLVYLPGVGYISPLVRYIYFHTYKIHIFKLKAT